MQPHSGANRGRKRGFAGDCAAGTGLVGRIRAAGVPPTSPPHAIKMHPTPLLYASQSTATNIITFETTPSRYTENKVLFSVPCVCARETFFGGHFWPFREPPLVSRGIIKQVPRCRRTGRSSVAVKPGHSARRVQSHPFKVH